MSDRWLFLVISLPGKRGAARMRLWRALKARGAGILRDGVYVLPDSAESRGVFRDQAEAVEQAGGTAYLLDQTDGPECDGARFRALFDRAADYAGWLEQAAALRDALDGLDEPQARRRTAQLRREREAIVATDYFAGDGQARTAEALGELERLVNRRFSPEEPSPAGGAVVARSAAEFRNRVWATRKHLWVDRVASAWLIRRFVDTRAEFLWLDRPADCPRHAVGFDFDGATFSHVGDRVTFEVIALTFGLADDAAIEKIGALVHYLDIGGVPVAEAPGFVALLAGARSSSRDDDALLAAASTLLDHLYTTYSAERLEETA